MDTTGGERQPSTDGEVRPFRDRSIPITVQMYETRIELRTALVLSIPIGRVLPFLPFGVISLFCPSFFFSFVINKKKFPSYKSSISRQFSINLLPSRVWIGAETVQQIEFPARIFGTKYYILYAVSHNTPYCLIYGPVHIRETPSMFNYVCSWRDEWVLVRRVSLPISPTSLVLALESIGWRFPLL